MNKNTISQKLVKARWDNYLLTGTWMALASIGTLGVYATLDEASGNIEGNMPHNMVARRPPRPRRREYEYSDTLTGNGITGNIVRTGF